MKVHYLGTGAAEGVPALFCNCDYCKSLRARIARGEGGREVRSRSQIVLDDELSIDFPPDAFHHMATFGVDLSRLKYLFFTHSHMDHCYVHDFILHGYKYAHNMAAGELTLFGNREVCEVFRECTRREMKAEVAATLSLRQVGPFEEVAAEDWRVYTLPAQHSSLSPLLYLFERGNKRVLHLTDTGSLPEEGLQFLASLKKHIDLVTLDCTFLFEKSVPGSRHMTLEENMAVMQALCRVGVADEGTKKVITHFSHNSKPTAEALARAEEYGVIAAYDGMILEI